MTRSIPKLAKLSTSDKIRKHGPSRLEKLLEKSIQHELALKLMKRQLAVLSLKIAMIEHRAS